ncbi:TPA: hypothetical protein G8O11_005120 [Salmonella enterica]|nr:hypothetical protein [Salmonella enterica]
MYSRENIRQKELLPCLALPCLALPCLALPCLALPCLALPCLALQGGYVRISVTGNHKTPLYLKL